MAIHESIETILLKRNRKAWRKDFGPKKFDSMLSESETEDKQRALRSGSYKPGDEAPKVSTQNSTVIQQKPDNSFYTDEVNSGTMRKSGHATNAGSDPYDIQEPRQVPYTNPYDIPQGYSPNDYVYKSTQQAPTNDPHGKTWTLEEQKKKQLQDAINARKKLEQSFVGMPTTEVVVKLGEHDDTIKKLSQELGVGDKTSTQNVAAPMSAPEETKPSVPTMTSPIPEYSQPDEPAWSAPKLEPADDEQPEFELYEPVEPQLTLEEQIQQNALDKPFGQLGALRPDWEKPQDGSGNAGGGYVNLYDDIPTMEDIEAEYQRLKELSVDEDHYETQEDYLAAILEKAVVSSGNEKEILKSNGYDNFGDLITDMQGDMRPNAFLDMKSKLEGMGYDVPKVGNDAHAGAYVVKEDEPSIWEVDNHDAEKILDTELQDLNEDYIEGSVELLKGPFEGKGGAGWNEIQQGVIQVLERVPYISDYAAKIKYLIPEIPSSKYRYYVVSADFDTVGGVVSETFQVEYYKDGRTRAYCRGGIFENNK